jgi:hypothetical protein
MENPSVAAQVIIAVIPIVAVTLAAVVAFFWFLWSHKEKVLLIQRGEYTREPFDLRAFCLLGGLVLTLVGSLLTAMFLAVEGFGYPVLGGAVPMATGLGLLIYRKLDRA